MSRAIRRQLARFKPQQDRHGHVPKPLDELEQFDSIERMFQQIRHGALEFEDGQFVIMSMKGEKYAILPALSGWIAYWSSLAESHGIAYNDQPMRIMAKKLEYYMPLTEADVDAAYAVVDQQRRMFRTIPRRAIATKAIEVMQSIQRDDEIKELLRARA